MAIDRVFLQPGPEEEQFLSSLRPRTLDACVGQHQVREQLRIAVEAARQRNEPVDHILLDGPPGLGKTTLANIVANELGRTIRITSGPAITRQGDLMSLLTQMEAGDVLFIDEIHRLNKVVEEFLYPALEDFRVDYTTDSGIGGRGRRRRTSGRNNGGAALGYSGMKVFSSHSWSLMTWAAD